jgi:WD40 repeat protein
VITGPTGLLASLEGAFQALNVRKSRADLRQELAASSGLEVLLAELRERVSARVVDGKDSPTLVIPIDQGEELFSAEGRSEADRFLEVLGAILAVPPSAAASEPTPPERPLAIVSIRSDSYERLQTEPHLGRVQTRLFNLPPIPRAEFKEVIEGPATRATAAGLPLKIDPELTELLLQDADGADALPLLAFTLERLLLEHGGDGELSRDEYVTFGGVSGSIEAAIEAAFVDPARAPVVPDDTAERDRLLRAAFVPWLASVDPETGERKRRVARWDEIPAPAQPLLERLIEQRLLIRDRRRVEPGGTETVVVEVAHEALLRRWATLTAWLDADADSLKTLEAARRAAAAWVQNERAPVWLVHTKQRLRAVESLRARPDLEKLLGEDGRAYIRACRERDDADEAAEAARKAEEEASEQRRVAAEQAAERERLRSAQLEATAARRLTRRTIGAAVLVVLLMAAGVLGVLRQQRAAEKALAASDVMEGSRRDRGDQPGQALAYFARAVRYDPSDLGARAALASDLLTNRWSLPIADFLQREPTRFALFSPDGKVVLTAAGDEARLWNAATGEPMGAALHHRNVVSTAAFNREGTQVVTGSVDRTMQVWDAGTGAAVGEPIPHTSAIRDVRFFTDDSVVAEAADGLNVWNVRNGTRLGGPFKAPPSWEHAGPAALFSGDGRRLAVSRGPHAMRLVDIQTGLPIGRKVRANKTVILAGFSDDGKRFVLTADGETSVLDADTGRVVRPPFPSGRIVAVSPNGRYALGVRRDGVRLWDVESGATMGSALPVEGVEYAAVGRDPTRVITVSKSSDRDDAPILIKSWNVTTGNEMGSEVLNPVDAGLSEANEAQSYGSSVAKPRFATCEPKALLAIGFGRIVLIWDVDSGTSIGKSPAQSDVIVDLEWSRDCARLVTVAGSEVRLWDASTGKPTSEPLAHDARVQDVTFAPDGRSLLTVSSRGARIWELATSAAAGEPVLRGGDPKPNVERPVIAFSADGRRVATCEGSNVSVWDASTGLIVRQPIPVAGEVSSLTLDRDGAHLLAMVSGDRRGAYVQVWDVATGRMLGSQASPGDLSTLSPDGRFVASDAPSLMRTLDDYGRRAILVWEAATGTPIGKVMRHRQAVDQIVFSPDGSTLVTSSLDTTARLWRTATGEPVGDPLRHDGDVGTIAFSADGARIVTVADRVVERDNSEPRTVRVWDARSGRPVGDPIAFQEAVTAAALSPDGSRVVTATGMVARMWDARTGAAIGEPLRHSDQVRSVTFADDGGRIATASGTSVQMWDVARAIPIGKPIEQAGEISTIRFVPSGDRLETVTQDDRAIVWDVPVPTSQDALLLAEIAELIGGYRVSALGAVEPLAHGARRLAALRNQLASSGPDTSVGRTVARWLLADPAQRSMGPLSPAKPVQQARAEDAPAVAMEP